VTVRETSSRLVRYSAASVALALTVTGLAACGSGWATLPGHRYTVQQVSHAFAAEGTSLTQGKSQVSGYAFLRQGIAFLVYIQSLRANMSVKDLVESLGLPQPGVVVTRRGNVTAITHSRDSALVKRALSHLH